MDRYLVQFLEETQEYFKTDCGFREGQLRLAVLYVLAVVDGLADVVEGQVFDTEALSLVLEYPQGIMTVEEFSEFAIFHICYQSGAILDFRIGVHRNLRICFVGRK